jgi:hypothetical protein
MVSTPGMFPFVVQELTDLVRHDANERFAMVEHGGIALVDNHANLLIGQILPAASLAIASWSPTRKHVRSAPSFLSGTTYVRKSSRETFGPRAFWTVIHAASTAEKKMLAWAPNVQFSLVRIQGA